MVVVAGGVVIWLVLAEKLVGWVAELVKMVLSSCVASGGGVSVVEGRVVAVAQWWFGRS